LYFNTVTTLGKINAIHDDKLHEDMKSAKGQKKTDISSPALIIGFVYTHVYMLVTMMKLLLFYSSLKVGGENSAQSVIPSTRQNVTMIFDCLPKD
jgi:hypothetical protein